MVDPDELCYLFNWFISEIRDLEKYTIVENYIGWLYNYSLSPTDDSLN